VSAPGSLSDSTGAAPSRFGRYRLLRRIGKGGMAEIFLAVMEGPSGFRRRCVVKRIRPDKARSQYFSQMFVDEARITAALHHPNIVQVYEFGEIGELYFLTMEYLDGKNLATVLDSLAARQQRMPVAMATHIAQQIARGLHHAHTVRDDDGRPLQVVHRDMSPTNVMLLRTGDVKVLDFGVAEADSTVKEGDTVAGRVKGKLSYMAPEQHSGRNVDARADIFALGVILWEMLTGDVLFSGENNVMRSRLILNGDATAPSELRPGLPRALDDIVLRCLAPMPAGRYSSANALAEVLGAVLQSHPFDTADLARLVEVVAAEPETGDSAEQAAFQAELSAPQSPGVIAAAEVTASERRPPRRGEGALPESATSTSASVEVTVASPHPLLPASSAVPGRASRPAGPPEEWTPVLELAPAPRWTRPWVLGSLAATAVVVTALVLFLPRSPAPLVPLPAPALATQVAQLPPPPAPPPPQPGPAAEPAAEVKTPTPRSHRSGGHASRSRRNSRHASSRRGN
jgi:serine/threonine protein kinase